MKKGIYEKMSRIVINTGTGPVEDSNREYASQNIKQFIQDCVDRDIEPDSITLSALPPAHEIMQKELQEDVLTAAQLRERRDGRYHFLLQYEQRTCLIAMPGCPLSQVRYLSESGQNVLEFPRLYVGERSSSWLWMFAVSDARRMLFDEEENEG